MDNKTHEQKFESVCELLETSETGLLNACKSNNISYNTFLMMIRDTETCRIRYARAKELQIETLINKIPVIQQECLEEIRNIEDPKRVNALQNAYKEQIRHIEWIASKLKAKTYGDKLDLTTNGNDITREIVITPIQNTTKTTTQSQPSQVQ